MLTLTENAAAFKTHDDGATLPHVKERDLQYPFLQGGGYLRLPSILKPTGILPISRSTWWAGIKQGRYPRPVKLGPRITAWRAADIAALIEQFEEGDE